MASATVIVPSVQGGERLRSLLDSLSAQTIDHETIVVDNGSSGAAVSSACDGHQVEVVRLERNEGYSRAVNLAARRAAGDSLVLLNDDSSCDPGFVEEIAAALDPRAGVVMAAGVMRDGRDPALIDSAGMELDRTLLVFDYLNGEPLSRLEGGVANPIGPSGAAAAFERDAFLNAGGFDERLFAYWEDVDLVLRLVRDGARCVLAPRARGSHEHSATLGSGSARKNYLMGFGRGYLLRKWGVVQAPGRVAGIVARDGVLCLGQLVVDRNLAGVRGRVRGYRAARPTFPYPEQAVSSPAPGPLTTLRRRASRRARLRRSR
jgi:N-acetylglucosaminyl-diphospho-decaprenol L-rhamnosyltransferase